MAEIVLDLNEELSSSFREWYPDFEVEEILDLVA